MNKNLYRIAALFAIILVLGACGAGADREAWRSSAILPGTVSGIAFDGLISNGTVRIYDFATGSKGNLLGTATSDNAGLFSVSLQLTSRPLLVEITGGFYTEEATGVSVQLSTKKLTALVNYTAGTSIQAAITTYSHMSAGLAAYEISKGKTVTTAIEDANNRFSFITGVSVLNTFPLQITDPLNASVTLTPELKYGFLAGAISMWVKNNAPDFKSIDFAQLAYRDILADGLLDGMGLDSVNEPTQLGLGVTPVNVNVYRYGIAVGMTKIANDKINNKTGILPTGILSYAQQYAANTDAIFNKVAPKAIGTPTVTITAIPSWVNKTINVTATVNDDIGLGSTELLVGNISKSISTTSVATQVFQIDTTQYPDGVYPIAIKSKNWAGLTGSNVATIRFDNTPPVLVSINPGFCLFSTTCFVSGVVSDSGSGIGTGTVVVNSGSVSTQGSMDINGAFSLTYPIGPGAGGFATSVLFYDKVGNCGKYTVPPDFPNISPLGPC